VATAEPDQRKKLKVNTAESHLGIGNPPVDFHRGKKPTGD